MEVTCAAGARAEELSATDGVACVGRARRGRGEGARQVSGVLRVEVETRHGRAQAWAQVEGFEEECREPCLAKAVGGVKRRSLHQHARVVGEASLPPREHFARRVEAGLGDVAMTGDAALVDGGRLDARDRVAAVALELGEQNPPTRGIPDGL